MRMVVRALKFQGASGGRRERRELCGPGKNNSIMNESTYICTLHMFGKTNHLVNHI